MRRCVVGFKVVEVRAGAVNLVRDVVAGAVREEVAEAGGANDGAGGIVGLKAANGAVRGEGLLDGGDGGIARMADGRKDESAPSLRFAADDAGPGDVVKDAAGLVETAPDIDEEEVAFADGRGVLGGGLVVLVGGVGVDADVGTVFPDETLAAAWLREARGPCRTRWAHRCGQA